MTLVERHYRKTLSPKKNSQIVIKTTGLLHEKVEIIGCNKFGIFFVKLVFSIFLITSWKTVLCLFHFRKGQYLKVLYTFLSLNASYTVKKTI